MRNSWKLAAFVALGASVVVVGCGDDDGDDSGGASGGGNTSKAGSSGSAGKATGGSSSGAGGSAGTAGKASGGTGAGGSSGSGGGGTSAGTDVGGAAVGGEGGVGAGGAPVDCEGEDAFGGAGGDSGSGGAGSLEAAVILIDNVQVKMGATVKHEWQFADDTQILDVVPPNNTGDKWSRYYGEVQATARLGFACDGNPAAGSLKNLVPFSSAGQYHEIGVPFAQEDYTGLTITAKVKLVSGGRDDAACPARAALFIVGPDTGGPITGGGVALAEGTWTDVTLTVATATGTTKIDRLGFNLNTYACAP